MSEQSAFDVVIVGGGPGGYPAAIRAAQYGLRVALVEKERQGGVCLNWGCIPTKAMLRSAEVLELVQHSADFGVSADNVRLDYPAVLKRKDTIVKGLTDGVGQLLKASGVTFYSGHARFTSPVLIDVVGVGASPLGAGGPLYNAPADGVGQPTARLAAKHVIIATGSTPAQLPIPGAELPGVINSDGAFMLKEVPKRIVIIGGGAVGTEWATMFSAFGAEVTLVELLPSLLPLEDVDMGRALGRSFQKRGMKILTSSTVAKIEASGNKKSPELKVTITDKDGQNEQIVEADNVLIGVSRRPNTLDLNLEKTGVQTDKRGYITVDDQLRTNVPNVFAVGDVVGKIQLAHVATHQGLVTAGVIAGHDERMDYKAVPAATFTHPEVASVGLTEAKAREAGHDVVSGKFPFAALGRAQTYGNTDGLIKVVADKKYGEILGVHIIGPSASDLIPEAVLALQLEATLEDVANTIHAHPTLGEGSMEAAMVALGLPVTSAPPAAPHPNRAPRRPPVLAEPLRFLDLGRIAYAEAMAFQDKLVQERLDDEIPDTLLLLEHPPVITLGRRASMDDIHVSAASLRDLGIEVHHATRGGLVTYHGPGQVVGYPIVKLRPGRLSVPCYVRALEQAIVAALSEIGVEARIDEHHVGVWTPTQGKIAAIGVAQRHGVTLHGFAVNLQPDLSHFSLINACGIGDLGVTSAAAILGHPIDPQDFKHRLTRTLEEQLESVACAALPGR